MRGCLNFLVTLPPKNLILHHMARVRKSTHAKKEKKINRVRFESFMRLWETMFRLQIVRILEVNKTNEDIVMEVSQPEFHNRLLEAAKEDKAWWGMNRKQLEKIKSFSKIMYKFLGSLCLRPVRRTRPDSAQSLQDKQDFLWSRHWRFQVQRKELGEHDDLHAFLAQKCPDHVQSPLFTPNKSAAMSLHLPDMRGPQQGHAAAVSTDGRNHLHQVMSESDAVSTLRDSDESTDGGICAEMEDQFHAGMLFEAASLPDSELTLNDDDDDVLNVLWTPVSPHCCWSGSAAEDSSVVEEPRPILLRASDRRTPGSRCTAAQPPASDWPPGARPGPVSVGGDRGAPPPGGLRPARNPIPAPGDFQ